MSRPAVRNMRAPWWRLVELGFRLLYNEMAFTYDWVSWLVSLGEWRTWQRAALKHLNVRPGDRVLELAHGTANLQIDLRTCGLDSAAIDLSPYMGRIARAKLLRNRIAPKLAQAQAQALPFRAASFPAAISTFPTSFIVEPGTLAEVYRVLKPRGRLVFVLSAALTRGGLVREGIELAYRLTWQRSDEEGWTASLKARFAEAGFSLSAVLEPGRYSIAQVFIAEKR